MGSIAASIDPVADPGWLRLLEHPNAGLFHSVPWLQALTDTYGLAIRAAVVRDNAGVPVAGIPYCVLDDCAGSRVVALPFTDACDPIGGSEQDVRCLLACLRACGLPLHLRVLDAALGDGLTVAKRARWHRLGISSAEAMWSAMAPAARRAVRKAERALVEIRPLDGEEGVHAFLRLHASTRKRKYRLLAQPARFFESIRNRFACENGWLPLGAFHGGRLIAATIYLRWREVLYYKFNASAFDALGVRPNNLLVWHGAQMARSLGCHTLDLGPSDDHQVGLIRFKRDTGASESELRFLRWIPESWTDPRGEEVRRLLGQLTVLLTQPEVPDEVAIRAGALLYRYFA